MLQDMIRVEPPARVINKADFKVPESIDRLNESVYKLNKYLDMTKDIKALQKDNVVKDDIKKKLDLKEKWLSTSPADSISNKFTFNSRSLSRDSIMSGLSNRSVESTLPVFENAMESFVNEHPGSSVKLEENFDKILLEEQKKRGSSTSLERSDSLENLLREKELKQKKLMQPIKNLESKSFSNTMDSIKAQITAPKVKAQDSVDLSKYFPDKKADRKNTGDVNKTQKLLKDVDLGKYFTTESVDRNVVGETKPPVKPPKLELVEEPVEPSLNSEDFNMFDQLMDGAIDLKMFLQQVGTGKKLKVDEVKESNKMQLQVENSVVRSPSQEYKQFFDNMDENDDISVSLDDLANDDLASDFETIMSETLPQSVCSEPIIKSPPEKPIRPSLQKAKSKPIILPEKPQKPKRKKVLDKKADPNRGIESCLVPPKPKTIKNIVAKIIPKGIKDKKPVVNKKQVNNNKAQNVAPKTIEKVKQIAPKTIEKVKQIVSLPKKDQFLPVKVVKPAVDYDPKMAKFFFDDVSILCDLENPTKKRDSNISFLATPTDLVNVEELFDQIDCGDVQMHDAISIQSVELKNNEKIQENQGIVPQELIQIAEESVREDQGKGKGPKEIVQITQENNMDLEYGNQASNHVGTDLNAVFKIQDHLHEYIPIMIENPIYKDQIPVKEECDDGLFDEISKLQNNASFTDFEKVFNKINSVDEEAEKADVENLEQNSRLLDFHKDKEMSRLESPSKAMEFVKLENTSSLTKGKEIKVKSEDKELPILTEDKYANKDFLERKQNNEILSTDITLNLERNHKDEIHLITDKTVKHERKESVKNLEKNPIEKSVVLESKTSTKIPISNEDIQHSGDKKQKLLLLHKQAAVQEFHEPTPEVIPQADCPPTPTPRRRTKSRSEPQSPEVPRRARKLGRAAESDKPRSFESDSGNRETVEEISPDLAIDKVSINRRSSNENRYSGKYDSDFNKRRSGDISEISIGSSVSRYDNYPIHRVSDYSSTDYLLAKSRNLHDRKREFMNERVLGNNPYMKRVLSREEREDKINAVRSALNESRTYSSTSPRSSVISPAYRLSNSYSPPTIISPSYTPSSSVLDTTYKSRSPPAAAKSRDRCTIS